ncbi:hypothetical protein D9M72_655100 [compost metagenome]
MHRAQRVVAARADAPEAVERKHLAVRVDAEDARRIGDQANDLRRLVGIVLVFLGVDEVVRLQLLVHLQEGAEHVIARAQPALFAHPRQ